MASVARSVGARISRKWGSLTASFRRRIVLGSLFALAVAARDLVLLFMAASFFALSEMAPVPRPGGGARPS